MQGGIQRLLILLFIRVFRPSQYATPRLLSSRTNIARFKDNLTNPIEYDEFANLSCPMGFDAAVNNLTFENQSAAAASTVNNNHIAVPHLNNAFLYPAVTTLVKQKRSLRRRWMQTRHPHASRPTRKCTRLPLIYYIHLGSAIAQKQECSNSYLCRLYYKTYTCLVCVAHIYRYLLDQKRINM